jgi:hypothetical protein
MLQGWPGPEKKMTHLNIPAKSLFQGIKLLLKKKTTTKTNKELWD